jgi:hypothetical protein
MIEYNLPMQRCIAITVICLPPPSNQAYLWLQSHFDLKIFFKWKLYSQVPSARYELTNKTILKINTVLRKHGFKGDDMKHFVYCIICTNNANVSDDTRFKMQVLPRATEVSSMLNYTNPILLIH